VKTNDRFRVAVVGAFGYAGGQMVRLLLAIRMPSWPPSLHGNTLAKS
jgi:hypothetical protein